MAQEKHVLTVEDLWNVRRIKNFDLSPDGKQIVFEITTYSMEENKGNSDIYLIDSDGTNLRVLKNSPENETSPKFSPDGKSISYECNNQILLCDYSGLNDAALTDLYTGASGLIWSNDGKKILFVSSVYPDCENQDCNKEKDEAKEASKVKAKIITELMYRHWDSWRDEKRSHLFLKDIEKNEIFDLTLHSKFDVPPIALGSTKDYSFSPDGNEAAFTMNTAETLAVSTNNDILIIDISKLEKGKIPAYKKISVSEGNDFHPVYSPDGKYIAYLSMERPGLESDKKRIMLYDRLSGESRTMTEKFDRSADEIIWTPDSKFIFFTAENEIYKSVYKLEVETGIIKIILPFHVNSSIVISPNGDKIFFIQQRTDLPHEIFSMETNGSKVSQITSLNKGLLSNIEFGRLETIWYEGAESKEVQMILIHPPFFNSEKKYPLLLLIHGGPQGHWEDDFHYRWNLQMFAAQGYVVAAPNPTGSTGYGQKFTDEISLDWGGKPYIDLMNCYDYVINNFTYIDKNNTFAAGASYGGYMVNWIEGHTEDRFNALVSHDGVFNLESMYGTTEELWFPEWEYGGAPWENRELYRKWSPHQYVNNFKTPMLVVHGAKDFRVPEEQAFQLFTSLQRMGVKSKFLYFPDENHFVTKPQNSRLWWDTVFNWFEQFKKE